MDQTHARQVDTPDEVHQKVGGLIKHIDGFLDSAECRIALDLDDAHMLLRYIKKELLEIVSRDSRDVS